MSVRPVNPPPTSFVEWSEEQRAENMARFLDGASGRDDLWVFGIGSLIWDPRFEPRATVTGVVEGWQRAFSFWSVLGRGTFETPGLGLALEPGGRCAGVAFHIPQEGREDILHALWLREMRGGVYNPAWVRVAPFDKAAGAPDPFDAICFTANPGHRNYAGILPPDETARHIAKGCGPRGTCAEYLFLLEESLDRHGLEDPNIADLAWRVRTHLETRSEGAGR